MTIIRTLRSIANIVTDELQLTTDIAQVDVGSRYLGFTASMKGRPLQIPLVTPTRRDDRLPMLIASTVDHMIEVLDLARSMARAATRGPPLNLLTRSRLGIAMVDSHGIDPQSVVDSIWAQAPVSADLLSEQWVWRTRGDVPPILGTRNARERQTGIFPIDMPVGSPWMYGTMSLSSFHIMTYVPDVHRVALRLNPKISFLRVGDQLPDTVREVIPGRPVNDLVDLPHVPGTTFVMGAVRKIGSDTDIRIGGEHGWGDSYIEADTPDTDPTIHRPRIIEALLEAAHLIGHD